MRVDQLVPAFHRGDAIGDEAAELRAFFRARGFESDVYCLSRDRELEGESRLFQDFPRPAAGDLTILHFALPSPLTAALCAQPGKKAVIHHNVTPARFFAGHDPEMARIASLGRAELASLRDTVDLALADSEFNRLELVEMGFAEPRVLPLAVDFAKYEKPPSRFAFELFRDERINILFFGRVAPNKRIEHLIKTVFYFKQFISPLVRLIVVGKTDTFPRYYESCARMADEFHLQPDEARFLGHVPDEEMFALYRASDVFLSLSEHEGFCLPLVESMIFNLPVIALGAAAVPYTLGEGGILLSRFRPDETAELVNRTAGDAVLKGRLVEAGRRELAKFKAFPREEFLMDCLRMIA
jgi:glycosyltransferase involved in cell wall biosynthesis